MQAANTVSPICIPLGNGIAYQISTGASLDTSKSDVPKTLKDKPFEWSKERRGQKTHDNPTQPKKLLVDKKTC